MIQRLATRAAAVTAGLVSLALAGCAAEPAPPPDAAAAAKIPVTSTSTEATELYLQGRDLTEKLRFADARPKYEQAVALDDSFALAHLGLANTSPTAQAFFASLEKAVAVSEGASEGERWMILAAQAGANADPAARLETLAKLVEAYPQDERAHNLVATLHFGRQEFDQAIAHYNKANEINPDFSPPYNQLGYAQRTLENYEAAEAAFKKYIELLPEEPNPYDSYAELLMKTGRFEESIENYELALSKDESFVPSYVGIGNNRIFMGQPEAARESFAKLSEVARNDGQRRQAHFWTAVSYLHEGNAVAAVAAAEERYHIAAATDDKATLSGDMVFRGNILLHSGDANSAAMMFAEAVAMIEQAEVSDDVKEATRRNHLFNEARVALHRNDPDTAAAKIEAYGQQVAVREIPFEVWRTHELAGMAALHREDHETAVAELAQANQQDPMVLYLEALACQQAGDEAGLKEFAGKAAGWNGLNLNYAFVKAKAEKLIAG